MLKRSKTQQTPKRTPAWAGMKLQDVDITSLRHHPENPRAHNEENLQAIMRSIESFQQLAPLVVWGSKNYVIVGNGRMEAMKRLGRKKVSIIRADHLSDAEAKSFMIADNKTTDMSTFDSEILGRLLQKISNNDTMLDATGFSRIEVEPLLTSGLPDAPEEFRNMKAPDGLADIDAQGSSEALGRIILVFSTEKERRLYCELLCLDPDQDTKQTFSFDEVPAMRSENPKRIFKKTFAKPVKKPTCKRK